MAITLDALAAALSSAAATKYFYKATATSEGAATWHSLWKVAGYPGPGINPPLYTAGSGYTPNKSTLGALNFTNASPGNNTYLAQFSGNSTVAAQLNLYDRMWACSGLTTNAITTLPITTPGTLSRDPFNGADVEPWIEIYTVPGAVAATWTLTGTDSTGTTGRTWTYAHPANAETAGQMMPFIPLTAVGGCRVPESLGFSIASGAVGDVGITLMRRIATISVILANNEAVPKDAFALGLPEIIDDSCLSFMVQCTTTTTGVWLGQLSIADLMP